MSLKLHNVKLSDRHTSCQVARLEIYVIASKIHTKKSTFTMICIRGLSASSK